jgi:hypothetical protein
MRQSCPKWNRVPYLITYLFLLMTFICLTCQGSAQTASHSKQSGAQQSHYVHINEQAELSRAGDVNATVELTHELFKGTEIPVDFADAFGFTDRIVNAESEHHRGRHPRVSEGDVVKAVNHLADVAGAPSWVKTDQGEVRKLRMHMLVLYPNLLASHEPADKDGHRKAISDGLRPIEAAYIATTMIYQKLNNPEYQFTTDEKKQHQSLEPDALYAKHNERLMQAREVARALPNNHSMRDLLSAGDRFFNDLGIASTATQTSSKLTMPRSYQSKGGMQ